MKAYERLIKTSYLSPNKIYQIIHHELDQIEKQGNNLSIETFKLGQFCRFNCKLIYSYMFIFNLSSNSAKTEVEQVDVDVIDRFYLVK